MYHNKNQHLLQSGTDCGLLRGVFKTKKEEV